MKKFLCILLAAAMCFCLFGCGSTDEPATSSDPSASGEPADDPGTSTEGKDSITISLATELQTLSALGMAEHRHQRGSDERV